MPQFGGASEKCTVCTKTVYLTEKIVVEDKEDKKTFHKTCLRCTHCKVTLSLGNYASMQGIFYCKPHFKQLFATKGNYDEGFGKDKHTKNWTPQAITAPSSFVPVDKDEAASSKKETPSTIASKFGKTSLNTEKCETCKKTVYATEKTVIEEKEGKKVYHKTCLKCAHCGVIVTLGNYASMQGIVYCKPHFKQLFAQKGNYDEGFGKEKASSKWEPQAVAAPSTFVPVDKDDSHTAKKATPESVASKFNKGTTGSEKCAGCGKTVYLTERIVVEDKEDKQTFHKTCLRCSHCQVVLTLGNYASMQGVMYCKPHFKQLFAQKGNYDEGFGKEKLTRKWQEKDGEVSEASAASRQHDEDNQREAERKREEEVRRREREERDREEREKEEKEQRERRAREEREREEREQEEREARERKERRAREEQEEREREEQEAREREEREERARKERRAQEEREEQEREEREREEQARVEREEREREEREKEEAEERERAEKEKADEIERQLAEEREREEQEEREREERAREERRQQEEEEREREEEEERERRKEKEEREREEREREEKEEREREERELEEREREREREEEEQEERRRQLEREESETREREDAEAQPREEEDEDEPQEEPQHNHDHEEPEPEAEHTHEESAEVHHEEEPAVETSEPTEEPAPVEAEPEEESAPAEVEPEEAQEAEEPRHHEEEERSEEVSEERSEEVSDE